ncbi:unnamed protein product [Parnassius apollo]|uniref:(apollo) hypothetical protein n=1 Tax=Parnassius apollo TaxID=110799 RepID=A0A8S3WN62_PARAO|nr:unnamed protein product [Parnassius apollo]
MDINTIDLMDLEDLDMLETTRRPDRDRQRVNPFELSDEDFRERLDISIGRHIEGHCVLGMIENDSEDLRLEVCPYVRSNQASDQNCSSFYGITRFVSLRLKKCVTWPRIF